MSNKASRKTKALRSTPRASRGLDRWRTWLAASCGTVLVAGFMPVLAASPASATPDPCVVTITPSVNDDSTTLGQILDDSLAAADGACSSGATFYLGTTPTKFEYQLPKSLEWTSDDTLAIIGVSDDTPILFAEDDTRVLTVADGVPQGGPAAVDLTRLSIRGGRVSTENGGGVFLEDATVLTLRQMEFLDNQAAIPNTNSTGGAVAAWEGTVVAISSRFEDNKADDGGGALSALHIEIQGSDFIRNAADQTDGWGGALWNRISGSVEVGPDPQGRPSRFIENSAIAGGAIFLEHTDDTSTIEAIFQRNSSSDSGGAIVAQAGDPLEVNGSTFEDDSTSGPSGGGAISADVPLTVTDSTFIRASAPLATGGAIVAYDGATIQDSFFQGNSAGRGGAIAATGDTVIAISSLFDGNIAYDTGGAIGADRLDIRGSRFINNRAPGGGGAITNWPGGAMVVGPEAGTPTRFIENVSQFGGSILVQDTSATALIEAQFERNSAYLFEQNWGDASGGAIRAWGLTQVAVSNSTFLDDSVNAIAGEGGAISSDAPLTVIGSTFTGTSAPAKGGAIWTDDTVSIEGSYFERNASSRGGALAITTTGAPATILNSTFWGNSADDSGSGVYMDGGGLLSVTASTFDDSTTNNTPLIAVDGGATASLAGTILSKDVSPASPCEGSIDDSEGNLVTAACGSLTVVSDDSLGLLQPALNQIYPTNSGTTPTIGLGPTSVALNRYYTNLCPSQDQRGAPRPQGTLCDAGAYEAGGIESITPPASRSASVGTPFTLSLSATGFGSGTFVWDDSGTTLPPGLTLSSTGVISGTPTTPGTFAFTARVTGPVDDSTTAQTFTVPGGPDPNPPGPDPSTPASPPQDVRAVAGIESATVSWLPPASTGTFPVTSYQAVATPGGQACMVSTPALSCTITGLTAGTAYTVTARALTGAGWSAASSPGATVVPLAPPEVSTILITSSRDRNQESIARIEGTTTGLVGAQVVPYIRVAGKSTFSPGTSTRTVDADGKFTWQRKAKKRFTVYFTSGNVTSNRLVIRPD